MLHLRMNWMMLRMIMQMKLQMAMKIQVAKKILGAALRRLNDCFYYSLLCGLYPELLYT